MERKPQEILNKLRAEHIPVYSFSRIETFHQCLYQRYRTYILHDNENMLPSIYGNLGGKIHDALEKLQNGEVDESYLLTALEEEIADMDMIALKFPKVGNNEDIVRNNWVANMSDFCRTYKKPSGVFKTEEFFLYETPNHHYLQGYIDLIKFNKDGSVDIYDYKSSSMYTGADIQAHARQLILYALALEQQGYKVRKVGWIFLKYVTVKYIGKKTSKSKSETEIEKVIERRKVFNELRPAIEEKLRNHGCDELDIEYLLDYKTVSESESCIPNSIRDEFKITPHIKYYPLTGETRQEAIEYFEKSIADWERLSGEAIDYPPREFTKMRKNGNLVDDSFFCSALCSYRKVCPYLKEYITRRDKEKEEEYDLF